MTKLYEKTVGDIFRELINIPGSGPIFIDLKAWAIAVVKDIQSGGSVDRMKFPESIKGEIAKDLWHDSKFTLGIEYGILIFLVDRFELTEEDLNG